jgi:hypothetical protein
MFAFHDTGHSATHVEGERDSVNGGGGRQDFMIVLLIASRGRLRETEHDQDHDHEQESAD